MEENYVPLNFRTEDGYKKIRLKKLPHKTEEIQSGLLSGNQSKIVIGQISISSQESNVSNQQQAPGQQRDQPSTGGRWGLEGLQVQVVGVGVPDIPYQMVKLPDFDIGSIKKLDIKCPLIPKAPQKGEHVFAYSHITYNEKINEPIYVVVEPKIDENDKRVLEEVKEYIQEKIDINFAQLTRADTIKYITTLVEKSFAYFKVKEMDVKRDIYKYYIIRDFIGMGKIEPFMQDKQIEDISCDGVGIPIYIYHRDPKLGSLRTNISFDTPDELDHFVNKLSERCGKTLSVSRPLLDGSLPDGSRIQATLGSDIARRGSNFTIRMFTEKPLTPIDLIKSGTSDLKMMAYCWYLVENGYSMLIAGGTASGKTTLLNVLSLFIKPQLKIVSIEDTAELKIPHAHWVPEVARTPLAEEGKVDMFELLRESLRQRPDYIIVGEVRGQEAYVLFQQMATGHAGLSTIHADNFPKLMDRLISPPISLPPSLIQNLDAILFVKRVKQGRRYIRKIFQIVEVLGYDSRNARPLVNEIFRWNAADDSFISSNQSGLLQRISDMMNIPPEEIQMELEKRAKVLDWLLKKNVMDYRKVAAVINLFYMSPDFLLERIGRV